MTQVSVCLCRKGERGGQWEGEPQPNLKKEELDRTSTFRGGCWERGVDFFQVGRRVQLLHNKLKSEIFNDKKNL